MATASKTTAKKTTASKPDSEQEKANKEAKVAGVLDKDEVKARFVEKARRGDFIFPEDMVRGLAVALGVEDDLPDDFFGFTPPPSRTAGTTER